MFENLKNYLLMIFYSIKVDKQVGVLIDSSNLKFVCLVMVVLVLDSNIFPTAVHATSQSVYTFWILEYC